MLGTTVWSQAVQGVARAMRPLWISPDEDTRSNPRNQLTPLLLREGIARPTMSIRAITSLGLEHRKAR
jgi:hypothetical protein